MKRLACLILLSVIHAPLSGAVPGGEALAQLIATQFDTNSDDSVDNGEWSSGITGSFSDLDGDGDGFIAADEIEALKGDIAGETGDFAASIIVVLIQKIVLSLDGDADALVSREEFEEPSTAFFSKLDADSDSALSLDELADLPARIITAPH